MLLQPTREAERILAKETKKKEKEDKKKAKEEEKEKKEKAKGKKAKEEEKAKARAKAVIQPKALGPKAPDDEEKKKDEDNEEEEEEDKSLLARTLEVTKKKGEARNVYMNLCYTAPPENSFLDKGITVGKVVLCAIDMFCSTTGASTTRGGSPTRFGERGADELAPGEVRAHAPAPTIAEILAKKAEQGNTPWNIPELVEKGFEIPIAVQDDALKCSKRVCG